MNNEAQIDAIEQFIKDKNDARYSAISLLKDILKRQAKKKMTKAPRPLKIERDKLLQILAKERISKETLLLLMYLLDLDETRGRNIDGLRWSIALRFFVEAGRLPNDENDGLIAECGRHVKEQLKANCETDITEHHDKNISKLSKRKDFCDEVEYFIALKNQSASGPVSLGDYMAYLTELCMETELKKYLSD
tara:strand:+ start:232 stop:807 length:576 start_codon:yes stop_codon:yes gene_type:complete